MSSNHPCVYRWIGASLILLHVTASCLFGPKPTHELTLTYCRLDTQERPSKYIINQKVIIFSLEMHLEMLFAKYQPICSCSLWYYVRVSPQSHHNPMTTVLQESSTSSSSSMGDLSEGDILDGKKNSKGKIVKEGFLMKRVIRPQMVCLPSDLMYSFWCLALHCFWKIKIMMTSSNGNIFRVTGPLCREFTGPRWIPRTKASDAELWYFLWSAPE